MASSPPSVQLGHFTTAIKKIYKEKRNSNEYKVAVVSSFGERLKRKETESTNENA